MGGEMTDEARASRMAEIREAAKKYWPPNVGTVVGDLLAELDLVASERDQWHATHDALLLASDERVAKVIDTSRKHVDEIEKLRHELERAKADLHEATANALTAHGDHAAALGQVKLLREALEAVHQGLLQWGESCPPENPCIIARALAVTEAKE